MAMARSSKMVQFINYRMRVTIHDKRQLVGTFMAFDRHMNIVLGDTEEYRRIRVKKGGDGDKASQTEEREEKRVLGLVRNCRFLFARVHDFSPSPASYPFTWRLYRILYTVH